MEEGDRQCEDLGEEVEKRKGSQKIRRKAHVMQKIKSEPEPMSEACRVLFLN